jgi:hypothetical protein
VISGDPRVAGGPSPELIIAECHGSSGLLLDVQPSLVWPTKRSVEIVDGKLSLRSVSPHFRASAQNGNISSAFARLGQSFLCTGVPEYAAKARQLICEDVGEPSHVADIWPDGLVTGDKMCERMLYEDFTVLRLFNTISAPPHSKAGQEPPHQILRGHQAGKRDDIHLYNSIGELERC